MPDRSLQHIQRNQPFGKIAPRRVLTLAVEQIRPFVRIAHRFRSPINIPERIIFDHEFVFIVEGTGNVFFGEECYTYKQNDLLFIPPFTPHCFTAIRQTSAEHIAVHFDFSPSLIGATSDLEERFPYEIRFPNALAIPRLQSLSPSNRCIQSFLNLVEAHQSNTPTASLRVVSELLMLLSLTLTSSPTDSALTLSSIEQRNRIRVDKIIAFIQTNLRSNLDADSLAEVGDISVSRMNTLFRQFTGYAPLEYVRRSRIAEARRLLADLNLSVKEIATRTGFEDSLHFSKVFRKLDGLSPTHYRDALCASRTI